MAIEESPTSDNYTVKIDGREEQVTLDELRQGYQRQSDYTRKTQELASERERLAQGEAIVQALEADPESAISALAGAFGVTGGNQTNMAFPEDDYEELDPDEVRLRRIESSIEEQNRALRQQNLQKEVNSLRDKYDGIDFDEKELYNHALKNKIGNLDAAFTHMNWEKMQSAAKDAEIIEEKRTVAQVVETSPGSPEGNVERAVQAVDSIRDAFALAQQELSD